LTISSVSSGLHEFDLRAVPQRLQHAVYDTFDLRTQAFDRRGRKSFIEQFAPVL
jgi:hypothetical protein